MGKWDVAILGVVRNGEKKPLHPIWKGARVSWLFGLVIGIWMSAATGSPVPLAGEIVAGLVLAGFFALLVRVDRRRAAPRERARTRLARPYLAIPVERGDLKRSIVVSTYDGREFRYPG